MSVVNFCINHQSFMILLECNDDDIDALKVKNREEECVPAEPVQNPIVVLFGDLMHGRKVMGTLELLYVLQEISFSDCS